MLRCIPAKIRRGNHQESRVPTCSDHRSSGFFRGFNVGFLVAQKPSNTKQRPVKDHQNISKPFKTIKMSRVPSFKHNQNTDLRDDVPNGTQVCWQLCVRHGKGQRAYPRMMQTVLHRWLIWVRLKMGETPERRILSYQITITSGVADSQTHTQKVRKFEEFT